MITNCGNFFTNSCFSFQCRQSILERSIIHVIISGCHFPSQSSETRGSHFVGTSPVESRRNFASSCAPITTDQRLDVASLKHEFGKNATKHGKHRNDKHACCLVSLFSDILRQGMVFRPVCYAVSFLSQTRKYSRHHTGWHTWYIYFYTTLCNCKP